MLKVARGNWIALASSLLLLAAVGYILSREHSLRNVLEVWQRTDPLPLAVAVVFMVLVQALNAWRLDIITASIMSPYPRFKPFLRIQLISQFVAHGAPISALADVAKAVMIKLRFVLTIGRAICVVLYDRICGALGAVLFGLVATIVQLATPLPQTLAHVQLSLWSTGLLGLAVLIAIGNLDVRTGVGIVDRVARVIIDFSQLLRRPSVAFRFVLASLGQLLLFAAIFVAIAKGMHVTVSGLNVMMFIPLIYFVSSLPIFYQGWGGREAIVIASIGSTENITGAEAVAISVAFGVVVFIASLPGAVFWIMRPSMRKIVRMEAQKTESGVP